MSESYLARRSRRKKKEKKKESLRSKCSLPRNKNSVAFAKSHQARTPGSSSSLRAENCLCQPNRHFFSLLSGLLCYFCAKNSSHAVKQTIPRPWQDKQQTTRGHVQRFRHAPRCFFFLSSVSFCCPCFSLKELYPILYINSYSIFNA